MKKTTLLIIGAIAMLAIAACTPAEPEPTDPGFPDDPAPPADDPGAPIDDPFEQVQEPDLPDVVATINGEEITDSEVLNFQSQMEMQGMPMDVETAVNQMITRKLLIEEAVDRGYEATHEDVEERLEQQGLPPEEAREMVEMQGMDYDEFLDEQVAETKLFMLIEEFTEEVEISEEQARQFYDEQSAMMGDDTPYEEVEEEIKQVLAEQEANNQLTMLAEELLQEADVQLNI